MQFDSFAAFVDMGGYGFYVWLSFGASLLLLALLGFSSIRAHKNVKLAIAQKIKREQKLKQAAQLHEQALKNESSTENA